MIKILDVGIQADTIFNQYSPDSIEGRVLEILNTSISVYTYNSINQLRFELNLRKNIINASKSLYRSNFSFKVFRKSTCNTDFWHRTDEGGFMLESGVKPSDAIKNIFTQSSDYGTECSTAMVIIYYKALLDTFPEELFNKLFSEIYLMNWQHLDNDLGIVNYNNADDYLPGDCRYFKNPDVDPLTPEWKGENVIDLGNETYYGHGIGIGGPDKIIAALNKHRIEGSQISAYLLGSVTRPDFKYLYQKNDSYVIGG
jgi:protein-glutamine gamma-glutamyltransferase